MKSMQQIFILSFRVFGIYEDFWNIRLHRIFERFFFYPHD